MLKSAKNFHVFKIRCLRSLTIHPTKKSGQFVNGSLLFDCQYLDYFFIKCNNQGQFPNPQEKLFLKLSLVVRFDKEFTDILTVKEKAFLYELTPFFVVCRFRLNIHKITL